MRTTTKKKQRPKRIVISLRDGSLKGRLVGRVNTTDVIVLSVPKARIDILKDKKYKKPGVYILVAKKPKRVKRRQAYVGHSDDLSQRLSNHNQKAWWERIYMVRCSGPWFSVGHAQYLEHKMYNLAKKANVVLLGNANKPGEPHLSLEDRADCERFWKNARMLLHVLMSEDIF